MLTCPACHATVRATQVYSGIATACPACGERFLLDAGGRRVDRYLGVTFGVIIVIASLGFTAGLWALLPALVAIGAYTAFALLARPWLVTTRGSLLPLA